MRPHVVLRYAGLVLILDAFFLFISAAISAFNSESSFFPLLYSAMVATLVGAFPLIFVPAPRQISNNEGLIIVVASWLLCCLMGTLPYVLWGGEFTFTNAWFESVSGYTTTGSTILTKIESLPYGILFWRSSTHWIGGMGIILFVLAVLPSMGATGMVLYRSEMSPLARENFRHNARTTLKILLTIYIGLTMLQTVALVICGMNLFDALTHSFATIATGGFSPKNKSVAFYDSVSVEVVIIIFMVLSGIHFALLFSAFFEKSKKLWKSAVVRYYVVAMASGILITTVNIHGNPFQGWGESLRYAAFQITSVGTSTGFANADTAVWPGLSQILLIFFSLQCACSGSTSGGIKTDRIVILAKAIGRQLKLLQHPRAVIPVRLDGNNLRDDTLAMTLLYIILYLGVVFLSTVLLAALGVDLLSAFSGTVAATGNVGPGLGAVGSMGNFSGIPSAGKWILSVAMLLGRLEIYGLLVFFMPQVWTARVKNPTLSRFDAV